MECIDKNTEMLLEYKKGNLKARDKLCQENMGLVYKVAARFSKMGVDMEDIVQTGAMGLLKAIDNFEVSFGVKFSTYAVPMIIGEIRRFLRDDGIIHVSRNLKTIAYHAYKAREELSRNLLREPTIEEIARKCEVEPCELMEALEATQAPDSINREMFDGSKEEISDSLKSEDTEEKIIDKIFVQNILNGLKPKERQIMVLRYFCGKTQSEISDVVGVSQVQVSRIEKKVIERLRAQQV